MTTPALASDVSEIKIAAATNENEFFIKKAPSPIRHSQLGYRLVTPARLFISPGGVAKSGRRSEIRRRDPLLLHPIDSYSSDEFSASNFRMLVDIGANILLLFGIEIRRHVQDWHKGARLGQQLRPGRREFQMMSTAVRQSLQHQAIESGYLRGPRYRC